MCMLLDSQLLIHERTIRGRGNSLQNFLKTYRAEDVRQYFFTKIETLSILSAIFKHRWEVF